MAYTAQQMAAAAEKHCRQAQQSLQYVPAEWGSVAEALCGLLALQLAAYAEGPPHHDDDDYRHLGPAI